MTKHEHISYSELKDWVLCPHYHKKSWIEKVAKFEGNEYTAFGTAIHQVCEKKLLKENIDDAKLFQIGFFKNISELLEKNIAINGIGTYQMYFLNSMWCSKIKIIQTRLRNDGKNPIKTITKSDRVDMARYIRKKKKPINTAAIAILLKKFFAVLT